MGALLVTVDGPHQRRQLSLPDDWPIRDLLPVLVDFVGEKEGGQGTWALRSGDRRLPEEESLTACGVGEGATLILDRLPARAQPAVGVPPTPSTPPPAPTPPSRDPAGTPTPPTAVPQRFTLTQAEKTAGLPLSARKAATIGGSASSPAGRTSAPAVTPPKLPQGGPGPVAPPAPPRQSEPSSRRGRRRAGIIGGAVVLLLLAAGAWWFLVRPRAEPPAPPRAQASPTAPPTRGLPPIVDLSAVVHGTIVGTDTIQVGYFSRTPEGATEAGRNYLWALAGTDDASTLLKQIAAPGQARALAAAAQENKDLLLEQFYLGFRTVQPTLPRYDVNEATLNIPVTGQTFEVMLDWTPDPTGGDWKLASVERLDTGAPLPPPAPS